MRKFLGSLFGHESDDPPPETQGLKDNPSSSTISTGPSLSRRVYGEDPSPDAEVVLKIVMIGGGSTGKTSIVRRYLQACFTHQYIPTIGIDLSTARFQSKTNPDTDYRVQFWDVAHAEVRGRHHKNIFRGAAGIVMVFDCCSVQSVSAVDEWRLAYEDCIRNTNTVRIPMVLLANKSDVGPPVIKPADLDTYCERGGYAIWRLTSSRNGNSVTEALDRLLDICIEFREMQQAARSRKKPEKLITSKSQLLSPPLRNSSMNNNVASSLGTSTSSSGSSVNDNSYVPSSAPSSASTPHNYPSRTTTTTTSTSSSTTTPRIAPGSRPPNVQTETNNNVNSNETSSTTSPSKPSESSNTTKTTNTTSPTSPVSPISPTSPISPISPITPTSPTSPTNNSPNNDSSSTANPITNKSNNKFDKSNSIEDSLDFDPHSTSNTLSDAETSSASASNHSSASASTHASQRNIASLRSGSTPESFAYMNGDSRPSIFSITNALAVEDLKLGELVNIAEDFYSKLKADLDQLFMNVNVARKSDLQILEFQRFDEYVKLMEVLRAHKEKAQAEAEAQAQTEGGARKYPTEQLQILLSENMKKWNQLIMNLHTEVSLYKSGIFDESRNAPKPVSSMKTSSSDTMLYSRYENAPLSSTNTAGGTAVTTGSNSPTKRSKDSSAVMTPPIVTDQGEGTKRQQQGATRRMGFGFRNAGKNPAAIFQLVNPTPTSFSLDNDNISSPPSPYNSVHSPTPSSPSTSPTSSSPPNFRSRASSNADSQSFSASSSGNTPSSSSSMQDSTTFRMDLNGSSSSTKQQPHKSHMSSSSSSVRSSQNQHNRSFSLSSAPSLPSLASHLSSPLPSNTSTPNDTPTTTPSDTSPPPPDSQPRPSTPPQNSSHTTVDTPPRPPSPTPSH